jgi:hypothetical protein
MYGTKQRQGLLMQVLEQREILSRNPLLPIRGRLI